MGSNNQAGVTTVWTHEPTHKAVPSSPPVVPLQVAVGICHAIQLQSENWRHYNALDADCCAAHSMCTAVVLYLL